MYQDRPVEVGAFITIDEEAEVKYYLDELNDLVNFETRDSGCSVSLTFTGNSLSQWIRTLSEAEAARNAAMNEPDQPAQ